MEGVDTSGCFFVDDDLLNFSLDDEDEETNPQHKTLSFSSSFSDPVHDDDKHNNHSFPEFIEEEELEWLSNKDAFPAVETCLDILSVNPSLALDHHSPVSVLENSSTSSNKSGPHGPTPTPTPTLNCCDVLRVPVTYPVGKRSKRRISRRKSGLGLGISNSIIEKSPWMNKQKNKKQELNKPMMTDNNTGAIIGRRCLHCQAEKTPQWRAGPMGPKTLCNACGVRYKSGRLVPEYRPASSPTFIPSAHSNSHRKIVEMRRQKQASTEEMINQPCG